jgi:hypothetical protein
MEQKEQGHNCPYLLFHSNNLKWGINKQFYQLIHAQVDDFIVILIFFLNKCYHCRILIDSVMLSFVLLVNHAIQLVYGTSVVLLRCPFLPEIMLGRAPEVTRRHKSWNIGI